MHERSPPRGPNCEQAERRAAKPRVQPSLQARPVAAVGPAPAATAAVKSIESCHTSGQVITQSWPSQRRSTNRTHWPLIALAGGKEPSNCPQALARVRAPPPIVWPYPMGVGASTAQGDRKAEGPHWALCVTPAPMERERALCLAWLGHALEQGVRLHLPPLALALG